MDEEPTSGDLTRSDLVAIFRRWNQQAREESWPERDDPEASADAFLSFAAELKQGEV